MSVNSLLLRINFNINISKDNLVCIVLLHTHKWHHQAIPEHYLRLDHSPHAQYAHVELLPVKEFASFIGEECPLDAAPGTDLGIPANHAVDNYTVSLYLGILEHHRVDYPHALVHLAVCADAHVRAEL